MKTTNEKYEYCLGITKKALKDVKAADKQGELLLKWAKDYYKDAEYYSSKKDSNTALEAIAYAHGFIDAGVLLGHLKIKDYHLEEVKWDS